MVKKEPTLKNDRQCGTCDHFHIYQGNTNGTCHYHPPHPTHGFPGVMPEDFCSFYRATKTHLDNITKTYDNF